MRLSLKAMQLCNYKMGKGKFIGFDSADETFLDSLSKDTLEQDFEELTVNGILDVDGDDVHISDLGQHIFNMMLNPDEYIILDNPSNAMCTRIYIRDIYYLYVLEDKTVDSDESYERLQAELLPTIELVVGAFTDALSTDEDRRGVTAGDVADTEGGVRISANAWDKDGNLSSEFTAEDHGDDIPALINKLTGWMLENISKRIKDEE